MTKRDWELFRYYHLIRGWLPCGWMLRNRVMAQIRRTVNDFLGQMPDADFEQIKARFGEPRQIAAACVDDMDIAELLSALRLRRRVMKTVGAVLAIALISWGATVTWAIWRVENSVTGEIYTTIVERVGSENDAGEAGENSLTIGD